MGSGDHLIGGHKLRRWEAIWRCSKKHLSSNEGTEVLAGGLTSGLWRFDGTWQRILGTPIRAILADPASADRYFLGTSGGVLVAGRTAPEFTDLRIPVEALTEAAGTYYAITSDRLLYESEDGATWTARAAAER